MSFRIYIFVSMEDETLKQAVRQSGFYRSFLAKKIGTLDSQLSEWMSGKRGLPKPAKEKLIEFLKIEVENGNN